MSDNAPLPIDVISDVVCPWCYIGKRLLEKAIALSRRFRSPCGSDPISSIRGYRARA